MDATVVTGLGVIAPTGHDAVRHWAGTVGGVSGIRRVAKFNPDTYTSKLAGQIMDFAPHEHLPARLLPQTDHMTRLALVAAQSAIQDAGINPPSLPEFEMGVVTASSAGGFEFGQHELEKLWRKGPEHVSAYQSFAWFYAVNTGQISILCGLRGPGGVVVTEQAGGLDAVAQARRRIREGVPAMLGGAADGSYCPWGWVAHLSNGRVSTCSDADRAYLPFDVNASGYVPGEGGAMFVLESENSARARGTQHWHGEIAGYATTFDPAPGIGRPPTLRRAIELALLDARLEPAEIGVVFADGVGVPELDRVEAEALHAVFGPHGVPVTVPKTMTGRLGAGGAALDLATALLTLHHGCIPPTVNVSEVNPDYQVDLVTSPRWLSATTALVVARGYGGFNSAMVVTKQRR
jgi:act minimal PKS chain-length factor (CLF/KS beta)